MTVDVPTDYIARDKGATAVKQLKRMIGRLVERHDDAAKLFIDETTGTLSPVAQRWFTRLADENYVNRGAFHADAREHAYREGRRALALEIIGSARLDVGRLDALKKLERETQ